MKQLDQRVTIRAILKPLTRSETSDYINFRLIKAGKGTIVFDDDARRKIYAMSKGIPRLINIISSRALMAAFVSGSSIISKDHVKYAIEHLAGETQSWKRYLPWLKYGIPVLAAIGIIAVGFYRFPGTAPVKAPGGATEVLASQAREQPQAQPAAETQPARDGSRKEAVGPQNQPPKSMPPGTPPSAPAGNKFVMVTTPNANMRSAPDVTSEQVAWVKKGATFPVLEQLQDKTGRTWFRVRQPNGKECWISKRVVAEKSR